MSTREQNQAVDQNKRGFIKATALGTTAIAAASIGAPAIAKKRYNWRMVTSWPRNFPGIGVGAQRLADRINAMSDGRLNIRVYPAGELVPALQSFDATIEGSAEMCHSASYYWTNKSEACSFFTGVPYGMTSRELTAWMRYLGGQQIWDKVYDQFGVKGFITGDTGTQAGGWFRKPVTGLADIKGMKFRSPGLSGKVWQKIGANVVNLAAGDIYQALQTGNLDATEFVGPFNDLALGFHQICKEYYMPSFTEPGLAIELVVNKSQFAKLPKDLQTIVEIACQAEYDQVASDYYANDPIALNTLVTKHGVNVRNFPEDVEEAGAKAAMEIYAEMRDHRDPLVRETVESFIKNLNLLRTRTEKVDQKYTQAREKFFHLKG